MASSAVLLPSYRRRNSSRPGRPAAQQQPAQVPGHRRVRRQVPHDRLGQRTGRARVVQVRCGQLPDHGPEHGQDVRVHRLPQPVLGTEVMDDQAGQTPAAAAIRRTLTAFGPRSANSRSASSRMTARAVRSSGAERMYNI